MSGRTPTRAFVDSLPEATMQKAEKQTKSALEKQVARETAKNGNCQVITDSAHT
jgi:hypothetical protein